jgi:hypothetical protein
MKMMQENFTVSAFAKDSTSIDFYDKLQED